MHDCALERKIEKKGFSSAPRVEHKDHCSAISTKTKSQNKIIAAPNCFERRFTDGKLGST